MSTLALKYRPRTFAEVTGQPVATRTLARSIQLGRVFQVALLHGPRGTGKTSLARLYAAALNCDAPTPTGDPCTRCGPCVATAHGVSPDVTEVDAASTRGIQEMGRIKELARYRPQGRYRVFILDEAHRITPEGWDSLLKMLEEPPPQAVFLFATTEPQGIPETIQSRALVLPLKGHDAQALITRLAEIAGEEGIAADPQALVEIARTARGGLRDAIKVLEQAHLAEGVVTVAALRALRLVLDPLAALDLVRAWVVGDAGLALAEAQGLWQVAGGLPELCDALDEVLTALVLARYGADLTARYGADTPEIVGVAEGLAPADLWRWRRIVGEERRSPARPEQTLVVLTLRALDRTADKETTIKSQLVEPRPLVTLRPRESSPPGSVPVVAPPPVDPTDVFKELGIHGL